MPINDKIKNLIGGLFGIGRQGKKLPKVGNPVEASPLPVDGDVPVTAQRPRIVPNQPISQDVIPTLGGTEQIQPERTITPPPIEVIADGPVQNDPGPRRVEPTPGTSELGTTMAQKPQSFMMAGDGSMPGSRQYMFALGRSGENAPADTAMAAPETVPSTATAPQTYLQSEIDRRLKKELYKGGKDEDKDHNWWDVLKSAGLGFRRGGILGAVYGGIEGAFDPNADERMGNEYALGQLGKMRQQEQYYEDQETKKKRETLEMDNIQSQIDIRGLEQLRKQENDRARHAYWDGILADKRLGRQLTATQIADLKRYRDFLIENGTRMTDARIKQIDERLEDYDRDRESREKIAGIQESGRDRRQRIQLQTQRELQVMRDAAAAGRQAEAAAARERLARLKQEYESIQ